MYTYITYIYINSQPSTLRTLLSTLNPQPFKPQASTLNPLSSTLNPQRSTLNPEPSTLNPEGDILGARPAHVDPRGLR